MPLDVVVIHIGAATELRLLTPVWGGREGERGEAGFRVAIHRNLGFRRRSCGGARAADAYVGQRGGRGLAS